MLKFFDWAYKNGDKLASDLDYVPLPAKVVGADPRHLEEDVKDKSGKRWSRCKSDGRKA